MKSVILFQNNESKYGVLGQMTEDLQRAFERLGINAVVRDFPSNDPIKLKEMVLEHKPDCTWSINMFIDEHWAYYPLGIPHVDLSVDSVFQSHPQVFSAPHVVSLYVDKASCDLFSAWSEAPVFWFPHAVSKEVLQKVRNGPPLPLSQRQYDVVLIGSFLDHHRDKQIWESLFDPSAVRALVTLAEQALADPSFAFAEKVLQFIEGSESVQKVLSEAHLPALSLLNSVERYARGLDRERLLRALHGRSVAIFTSTEDANLWSQQEAAKTCSFCSPVPFSEVIQVCRNSKVVVNSAPHIRKGYHERLFLSLASGAVTLVGKGHLLPSWLSKTGRVVEYDSSSLQGLLEQLQEAEKRPFDVEKILSWLEKEHTFDARLHQHLPEIEASLCALRAEWEANHFWRVVG